jgi:hypothetical protein
MKMFLSAIFSAVTLFASAPVVSAQSSAYHCVLYTKNAGKDVRFSSTPVRTQADAATLNAAWKQYVVATYHVSDQNAYGGCQAVAGTLAQQEIVVTAAEENYKRLGATVVQVSWASAPGQTFSTPTPPAVPTHVATAPAGPVAAPAPPAQSAAAPAASPAPVPAAAPSAPPTASSAPSLGGPFISCSTSGGAGIDTYLTGVFQTTLPVRHLPSGGNLVDQTILDRFYAYLKQKGYNFKPGSNYGCDVSPTEQAARAAQHKRAYEGGGCSTCGKTVETGWKDQ